MQMSLCFKRCVTKQEECFKANVIALTRINIRHVDFFLALYLFLQLLLPVDYGAKI